MMLRDIEETPSLLKGEVTEQFVRCGKSNCRCRQGEMHGPYHYRVWREGEKIRKQYVRPEDVEAVRNACQTYQEARLHLRAHQQSREALSRSIRQSWHASRKAVNTCDGALAPLPFPAPSPDRAHAAKVGHGNHSRTFFA